MKTQAGSGCSVPNHTVLTRTAQWKRKLDQGVLSRIIPYCTDPYRSVETQAGSGCSVPNHTVLYWPVPLSGNASWIRVFCPESYRTVLTSTAQLKRKLDQGVLSRIISYCTDPYRSVETQAGSGCSVPNHTVLYWPVPLSGNASWIRYWPVPLSGNASWIRVFCPESYRTVPTRTAQWKRKLDQGVLSRIIPYCTDPYRSVETQAGSGCSVPNHTVLYWPVPLSGNASWIRVFCPESYRTILTSTAQLKRKLDQGVLSRIIPYCTNPYRSVETQAGSGCSVPNHTVLYRPVPLSGNASWIRVFCPESYRTILTRTAQWKRKLDQGVLSRIIPYCTDPYRSVETQAGSGCSVPNHTILYRPVPLSGNASWIRMFCPESYRTVLTRTAQWKRKLDQGVLSRIIPYYTDQYRSVETQAGSGCSVPNHTVLYQPVPLSGNASWIRVFCPESYRTVPTRTAQWKRKLDQGVLSRIIPYYTDPYRSVETQAGSGCSVPNHTVLYWPVPLSWNASWIRVFCPESYRTVLTRTAQWKRKLDQGVLSRIIPYCTDPYRSVKTQAGSGCSVPNHTVLYWPVPLSENASWIRVFCPESYRTVLTRTAQWKRKLDQGVLSRIIPYCTDPYRSVETQAGSGCSVLNHIVLYWPVPLSGNASWIRVFCPESYRTVPTRTAQWKRKLDQGVLSRIIPYCTDPYRSVETQAGSGCSVPNHTVLYWPVPLSGNASWIRVFCPESYRTILTSTAQLKRKLDQGVLSRIIPYYTNPYRSVETQAGSGCSVPNHTYCTDPYRSVETQAGSGCSVPNHTVLYWPVPLSWNASWIRVFCPESYRTVLTRTAQLKRKLDQGVLSRIIPYCTDPYRSVKTQAGSGCSVPNHTVLYWPVPLSENASWIRVFCPESYRTVLTRTAQWKRKLDQGVLSRIIPYCTDPYRSVETQAGSGCSVLNHTVLYWPVPLSGNASWIRVFCPESYRTVLTRTAQLKRKLDQGVLSRIIPYCTDPYRSVDTSQKSAPSSSSWFECVIIECRSNGYNWYDTFPAFNIWRMNATLYSWSLRKTREATVPILMLTSDTLKVLNVLAGITSMCWITQ